MTSGNRPVPEQGSWNVPGATSAYQPVDEPRRADGRGRPGLVALVVAITELVIIAAVGNQAVTKHTNRYFLDHSTSFLGRVVASTLQVAWRFKPLAQDNHDGVHLLYAELAVIAVFVALSALLAAVAARGPVTFWRVFLSTWTGAIVALCVGRLVGALLTKPLVTNVSRVTNAFFSVITSLTFFAGAVIGLVAALVAAAVAVAGRRPLERPVAGPAQQEPAPVPETPPPFYGNAPREDFGDRGDRGDRSERGEPDGCTTQLPRFDPSGGKQWTPPRDGDSTQALPVEDDERRS